MIVKCGWCGQDLGTKPGPRFMVGHGICAACEARLFPPAVIGEYACTACGGTRRVTVYGVLTGEIGDTSTDEWLCDCCHGTGARLTKRLAQEYRRLQHNGESDRDAAAIVDAELAAEAVAD